MTDTDLAAVVADHRGAVREWLASTADVLAEFRVDHRSAEAALQSGRRFTRLLFDQGWGRCGWPQTAGGLGGPAVLRHVLYDELEGAGYPVPVQYEILETMAPSVLAFAPAVAKRLLPAALSGERPWAQGFSEPEAGSDLASLRCRARRDGDDYVVCGQKIWTSHGVGAACIGTLVRTGTSESRHRGLSMLMIDLDVPGVGVRPIRFANGHNELAEVFFDDVRVPADRLVGAEGQGWDVAMFLLQYERGNYAWMRQAHIGRLVATLAASADASDQAMMSEVGAAWLAQQAVRIRCGRTVLRLGAGEALGPDISIDKVLLGAAEQRVCDAAQSIRRPEFVFSDADVDEAWRANWFYTRASTIYGGAAEIQRSIIADRVLKLPKEGR
ncbi:acyl-CoA dehydrogenase family protein [Mycolicibacterium pyrenivorans]|uniref:acyl-CoA dehydrogenase family protein n=1 Tax=Mycolicibacterium pyrenivorans TaxID=187102 RepID=UPI0021F2EF6B|nr:acyl-CoA dehydrogenase family protein [Mycolicibacterium pyrenivorans]MCV7154768.1 acyl-CoA dehydrogenase family protein [Mycolicibacterium pyrenivorans]